MSESLIPAEIEFTEEGPLSGRYGDRYHGRMGALNQALAVFIEGNALANRWARGETLTVLETGFGLGFNFLATWLAWKTEGTRPRLHFVSIEAHPIDLVTLSKAHEREPEIAALARELRLQMPRPHPGIHRLHFEGGLLNLTLIYGHDVEALKAFVGQCDAIYLDGFAPDRNPAMWSETLMASLFSHARPGATLSTWCASGDVRRKLESVGFIVSRGPGLDHKRETTRALVPGTPTRVDIPERLTIIGAGLAGSALATKALERGMDVALIEAGSHPGAGASGNPTGVIRPLFNKSASVQERFTLHAFEYALRDLETWPELFRASGVLHLAKTPTEWQDWEARFEAEHFDPLTVQACPPSSIKATFDLEREVGGVLFPRGGWVQPGALCQARIEAIADRMSIHWNTAVKAMSVTEGAWTIETSKGSLSGDHPLVFASGAGFGCAEGLDFLPEEMRPLARQRGEITRFQSSWVPRAVISGEGYLTPSDEGDITVGATYDHETHGDLTERGQTENLERLKRLSGIDRPSAITGGRASWRSIAQDRLPIIGQDPRYAKLWHCRAFASRGLVWHALGAEFLLNQILDEPRALDREGIDLIAPNRPSLKRRATRPA